MFLAVVCSVMMGISRRFGDFLMKMLSINLRVAFEQTKKPNDQFTILQQDILGGIPKTIDTAMALFDLDVKSTTYAVCEECHCTYAPTVTHDSILPVYPEECTNVPSPGAEVCGASLLKKADNDGDTAANKPKKTFVYHHFHDYLAGLLSRKDIESLMDKSCDDLSSSIRSGQPAPKYVTDVFEAEFLRTFQGPIPGQLFVNRPNREGRYVFALSFDFFRTEGMKINGASTSSGLISAACMNLPLSIRYNPENMYIAGIVPGPQEPLDDELNHYIRPLIDDLLTAWERGVHYSRTACHPNGRDTRSAVALCVCDLPGGRKLTQTAHHSSNHYCSVCHCWGIGSVGRTDFESPAWRTKEASDQRTKAERYRNASTLREQTLHFKENGIRWTELWRLPYWDPARMLVVDCAHCLLEGNAHFHFRHVLGLTDTAIDQSRKEKMKLPSFEYTFPLPSESEIEVLNLRPTDLKMIPEIHQILRAAINSDNDNTIQDGLAALVKRLNTKKLSALAYVSESVDAEPDMGDDEPLVRNIVRKADYSRGLVNWVRNPACISISQVWN